MQVALYGRSRPVVLDLDRDVGCRAWNLSCPFEVNERAREAPVRFKQELAACLALPNAKTPIRAEAVAVPPSYSIKGSALWGASIMKTAAEYRKHAEECRVLARQMPAGEQRDQLLEMART